MRAPNPPTHGLTGLGGKADRLAKSVFDSIADLPAPEHLLGLVHELDDRFPGNQIV